MTFCMIVVIALKKSVKIVLFSPQLSGLFTVNKHSGLHRHMFIYYMSRMYHESRQYEYVHVHVQLAWVYLHFILSILQHANKVTNTIQHANKPC